MKFSTEGCDKFEVNEEWNDFTTEQRKTHFCEIYKKKIFWKKFLQNLLILLNLPHLKLSTKYFNIFRKILISTFARCS
jgi:hypothetical protein